MPDNLRCEVLVSSVLNGVSATLGPALLVRGEGGRAKLAPLVATRGAETCIGTAPEADDAAAVWTGGRAGVAGATAPVGVGANKSTDAGLGVPTADGVAPELVVVAEVGAAD